MLKKLVIGFLLVTTISGCTKDTIAQTTVATTPSVVTTEPSSVDMSTPETTTDTSVPTSTEPTNVNIISSYETKSVNDLFEVKLASDLPEELAFVTTVADVDNHSMGNFGVVRNISSCSANDPDVMCQQGWVGYFYCDTLPSEIVTDSNWTLEYTMDNVFYTVSTFEGNTLYIWTVDNYLGSKDDVNSFKEDKTQWFVDYLNDPSTLANIYHPENIIMFN